MQRRIKFLLAATFFIASSFGNFLFAQTDIKIKNSPKQTPILEQIEPVEAKKKELCDLQQEIEEKILVAKEEFFVKSDEKVAEVENMPFKPEELVDGEPTEAAKMARARRIESLSAAYDRRWAVEETRIRKTFVQQKSEILSDIDLLSRTIARKQMISSAAEESDLKYSIGTFNEESSSWPISLSIPLGKGIVCEQNLTFPIVVPASASTTASTTTAPAVSANDVLSAETADSKNLIFEVDYTIKSTEYPSQYEINFLDIRMKDKETKRVLGRMKATQKTFEYDMSPVYDISEIVKEVETATAQIRKTNSRRAARMSPAEYERKEKAKAEIYKNYVEQKAKTVHGGVGFNKGGYYGFDIDFDYSVAQNVFVGGGIGMLRQKEGFSDISNKDLFRVDARVGANMYINMFKYPPNFFFVVPVGIAFNKEAKAFFSAGASIGLDIPIVKFFGLYGKFNFKYLIKAGKSFSGELGVFFRF